MVQHSGNSTSKTKFADKWDRSSNHTRLCFQQKQLLGSQLCYKKVAKLLIVNVKEAAL